MGKLTYSSVRRAKQHCFYCKETREKKKHCALFLCFIDQWDGTLHIRRRFMPKTRTAAAASFFDPEKGDETKTVKVENNFCK